MTKRSIAAQVMIHSLSAAPVDMALIKRFGHVTYFSWQDKQEVNPSHIESWPDSSSFLFLTLYGTQYDINEEKNVCDIFPAYNWTL